MVALAGNLEIYAIKVKLKPMTAKQNNMTIEEIIKEAFSRGWNASHECATDFDYDFALNGFLSEVETEVKKFRPIKLTDDILVKMGFTIQKGDWSVATHKVNTDFAMNDKLDGHWRFTPIWCKNYKPIIYVHELQNLYFCLFGEELSIA